MRYDEIPLAQPAPLTKDNPAVVAYVGLIMAQDLMEAGKELAGRALLAASAKMALESGRLPPGTFVPDDVWREVEENIRSAIRRKTAAIRLEAQAKALLN